MRKKFRTTKSMLAELPAVYEYTVPREPLSVGSKHAIVPRKRSDADQESVKCACGETFLSAGLHQIHVARTLRVHELNERSLQYPVLELASEKLRNAENWEFPQVKEEVLALLRDYAHCTDAQLFLHGSHNEPERFIVRLLQLKSAAWRFRLGSAFAVDGGCELYNAFKPGDTFAVRCTATPEGLEEKRLVSDVRISYEVPLLWVARESKVLPVIRTSAHVLPTQQHAHIPARFDTRAVSVDVKLRQHQISAEVAWRTFLPAKNAPISLRPFSGDSVHSTLQYTLASHFAWTPLFRAFIQHRLVLGGLLGGESRYMRWEGSYKVNHTVADRSGTLFEWKAHLSLGYIHSFDGRVLHPLDRHYHSSTLYWNVGPHLEPAPSIIDSPPSSSSSSPPSSSSSSSQPLAPHVLNLPHQLLHHSSPWFAGSQLYYSLLLGAKLAPIRGVSPVALLEFTSAASSVDPRSLISMIETSNVSVGLGAQLGLYQIGWSFPIVSKNPGDRRRFWFTVEGEH